MNKYYFDSENILKYDTVWYGFFKFSENIEQNRDQIIIEIGDKLVDLCDCNFHIKIHENIIYLSLENDGFYYHSERMEKDLRNIICTIEQLINSHSFEEGEMEGIEYKPYGNQYRYKITKDMTILDFNKKNISIKKTVLNWSVYEKLKKK